MPTDLIRSSWFQGFTVATIICLAAGVCAAQPVVAADGAAPIPPGQARVWFYRVFFPEDTGGMPAVAMNGSTIGYARAGWSFYRDVPAGGYHITVATVGLDIDQAENIALAPGAQAYLAIQSDPTWVSSSRSGMRLPTYYVGVEPPNIAAIHFSQSRLGTGY
jgi:hypothetical protein